MSRSVAVAVSAVAVLAGLAPGAGAATLSRDGSALVYTAAPGEFNRIEIHRDAAGTIVIRDPHVRIKTDDSLCVVGMGGARCEGLFDISHIEVHAGDLDDRVTLEPLRLRGLVGGQLGARFDGGEGDDLLEGAEEPDHLAGGPGNDWLHGDGGGDTLVGGPGADLIRGGANGRPTPSGVPDGGDSVTYAGSSAGVTVTLDDQPGDGAPGEGDDVGSDIEHLTGTSHDDVLVAGAATRGSDLTGGDGDDRLETLGVDGAGLGGPGDDTLVGGPFRDVLVGEEGADQVFGSGGGDSLGGGDGTDVVAGEAGDDHVSDRGGSGILLGGEGNDVLSGGTGSDAYDAGDGDDSIEDSSGADVVRGGAGRDRYQELGGAAHEANRITLDDQPDDGQAGEGRNVHSDIEDVTGGAGDDTIVGDGDANVLSGGWGADTIDGGAGPDRLLGGPDYPFEHFPGEDLLLTRDGQVDELDCDQRVDSVQIDAGLDGVAANCETVLP